MYARSISYERRLLHGGADGPIPNEDAELGPRLRDLRPHARERDPHLEHGGHRPARDDADLSILLDDATPVAGNPALLHQESDEAIIIPAFLLAAERLAPDELVIPLHEPLARALERRLPSVEVRARKEVPFLEAQRVPRPEPDRRHARVLARRQNRVPHGRRQLARREQLEPVLARVAGPRHEADIRD